MKYFGGGAPFLQKPVNFSGPKATFEINTCWIVHKPVNFASLAETLYDFQMIIEKLSVCRDSRKTDQVLLKTTYITRLSFDLHTRWAF